MWCIRHNITHCLRSTWGMSWRHVCGKKVQEIWIKSLLEKHQHSQCSTISATKGLVICSHQVCFESEYTIIGEAEGAGLVNLTCDRTDELADTWNSMDSCKYARDYSQACVWEYFRIWLCIFIFWAWIIHGIREPVCFSLNKPQFYVTKTQVSPLNTSYSKYEGTYI